MKTTIRAEIQKPIILLVIISTLLLGVVGSILTFVSTRSVLKMNMEELAETSAQALKYRVVSKMNLIEMMGSISRFSSNSTTLQDKRDLLDFYQETYGWEYITILDVNGTDIFGDNIEVSEQKEFQNAVKGTTQISDPIYKEEIDKMISFVYAPLWQGGEKGTSVAGVIMVWLDAKGLSDMTKDIAVSDNSSAYILSSEGIVIAHKNYSLVLSGASEMATSKAKGRWSKQALLEQKAINGEVGFGHYYYEGESKLMAYAPLEMDNGWCVVVAAPYTDFLLLVGISILISALIVTASVVMSIIVAKKMGQQLGEPIEICTNRLKLLAQGDLKAPVPEVSREDETLVLANSTRLIVDQVNKIIGDIDYILGEMADGNFAVRTRIGDEAYVGDFKQMLLSVREVNTKLKDTLSEIHEGSRQVEIGATQMAESAQNLAEGATDQAGSVEELLAAISEVAHHVDENKKTTNRAYERTRVVADEAQTSQKKMKALSNAMQRIEDTSNQISNIIENIEDIASQTNLLSLNAAIEAARAGEAGKGFAVVAEQIRKLAEQSASSAVDTRKLIESAIEVINEGGVMTKDTAEYLNTVMGGLEEILESMNDVHQASDKQAEAMNEIEQSVEMISQVVESNSAAAQESSATSEELSAQAENLNALVNRFTLK